MNYLQFTQKCLFTALYILITNQSMIIFEIMKLLWHEYCMRITDMKNKKIYSCTLHGLHTRVHVP